VSRVSVVIPVFNGERYLADAVASALAQTRPPDEIWVSDDGSTDGSAVVAGRFPSVCLLQSSHGGPAAARNRGVEASTGDVVAFLDCDDLWLPTFLERGLAVLAAQPGTALFFGGTEQFYADELSADDRRRFQLPPAGLNRNASSVMARKSVFEKVGLFDPKWRMGEFVEWLSRAELAKVNEHVDSNILVRRRIHGANRSLRERRSKVDFVRIMKERLDAKRNPPAGAS
jgi:glycosyltransferase involved in cell wall biosynthesis